jgi:AraC-like DNA-binding protein
MAQIIRNSVVPIVSDSFLLHGEVVDQSNELKKIFDPDFARTIHDAKAKDLYLPNFSVRSIELKSPHDLVIVNPENAQNSNPGFGLFFEGSVKTQRQGDQDFKVTKKGEQNFLVDPHGEIVTTVKADTTLAVLMIIVDSNYFDHILPEDEKWSDELRRRLSIQEPIHTIQSPLISIDQQRAIRTVFENPMSGKMRVNMQEATLLQILLHHLQGTFKQNPMQGQKIHKRDYDIMRAIREHLAQSFTDDHSLSGLALQFGINQNKLTTNFRQIFGVSVFEYISTLKMEFAKKLLEKEGLQIKEVAPLLGYKNPHHFAVAFKKKFGTNPSKVMK